MIHRLSKNGGALCGTAAIPKTICRNEGLDFYTDGLGGLGGVPETRLCSVCEIRYYTISEHACLARPTIVSAEIQCPRCNRFHVDREEWYHKLHHCHRCEHCGNDFEFVPDSTHKYSRGIEPVSVRGRLTALRHTLADWLYERLS